MAELVEQRSATTKRFRMSDGSVEAELFSGPVHYRDQAGKWQDVDTRPAASNQPDWALENSRNSFTSRFGKRSDRLVAFDLGGRSIAMGIAGPGRAVTPSVVGSTVTYPDVFGTADVRYHVGPESLKEEIVLDAAPTTASYTFMSVTPSCSRRSRRTFVPTPTPRPWRRPAPPPTGTG